MSLSSSSLSPAARWQESDEAAGPATATRRASRGAPHAARHKRAWESVNVRDMHSTKRPRSRRRGSRLVREDGREYLNETLRLLEGMVRELEQMLGRAPYTAQKQQRGLLLSPAEEDGGDATAGTGHRPRDLRESDENSRRRAGAVSSKWSPARRPPAPSLGIDSTSTEQESLVSVPLEDALMSGSGMSHQERGDSLDSTDASLPADSSSFSSGSVASNVPHYTSETPVRARVRARRSKTTAPTVQRQAVTMNDEQDEDPPRVSSRDFVPSQLLYDAFRVSAPQQKWRKEAMHLVEHSKDFSAHYLAL
ncbi:hypothetical protein FVE85_4505 [Porphyridium purpureum]|uniref:Uncharacterized protein n=1 Tax=Porphyridium purpureum TaxID=35688 RepID=A0A5J4YIM5_PORPP|nr:hypothetical protein FVE85_4505 [Porphyridium purpureum]|eukprot:POR1400..scf297_16